MALDSLDIRIRLAIEGKLQKSWNSGKSASADLAVGEMARLLTGTGLEQCDIVYYAERTVASNTADSIDLSGSLKDPTGGNAIFVELVLLLVINKPMTSDTPNTTTLQVGAGSNCVPLFADVSDKLVPIGPGGMVFLYDPDAGGLCTVTAATGDLLAIVNSTGAANTYQVLAIGRSA